MPTLQSMHLPKPANWQDFETLTRDALGQLWESPTLQKNGRGGQAQQGVDIYGPDYLGRPVGIQCKRYSTRLTLDDVKSEIDAANKFKGLLTTLYLATTTDNDSVLQQSIRSLSESRAKKGQFAIGILFWEDIVRGLVLNPAVFRVHYPQVVLPQGSSNSVDRLSAALELGYFGANIPEFQDLIYGEYGWLAQEDPDKFVAKMQVVSRHCERLFAPDDARPILKCIDEMLDALPDGNGGAVDWGRASQLAKRATNRIENAKSLLTGEESKCLDVGLQLGQIFHSADSIPPPTVSRSVEMKLRSILGDDSYAAVSDGLKGASTLESGYRWAMRIYSIAQREIRYRKLV